MSSPQIQTDAERIAGYLKDLRAMLPPGATVYSIQRSRSRSGMSRIIDFYAFDATQGRLQWIGGMLADVLRRPLVRASHAEGLRIRGVGFDAAGTIAAELGILLHNDDRSLRVQRL